jgi:hypothetical protein
MRFHVILGVAALALAGCNANQAVNPSSQPPSQVFAGHYEDYNPYDPISYAQNNTGRARTRPSGHPPASDALANLSEPASIRPASSLSTRPGPKPT